MLATYCRERGVPLESMQRAVVAAEPSILIFEWPAYAAYDSTAGTRRVRERGRHLAELWAGFH